DDTHLLIRTTQINSHREVKKIMKKNAITNDLEEIKMSINNRRGIAARRDAIYSHNLRTYAQY
ncbi:MAG: hypothetical protein ACFFC1_04445, partial [Promethearchaeota archaeon]